MPHLGWCLVGVGWLVGEWVDGSGGGVGVEWRLAVRGGLRRRDRLALRLPSLLLRLVLGLTFLWAGLGKVVTTFEVEGAAAASLANRGVGVVQRAATPRVVGAGSGGGSSSDGREGGGYVAGDFTSPVEVRGLYRLVLAMDAAGRGVVREDGSEGPAVWPGFLLKAPMPMAMAYGVVFAELFGGVFLLIGLLTRLSALAVCGVMLGAVMLTEVGPAVQSGAVVLGFIPDRPMFDPAAWTRLFWQLSLLAMGLAVALLGPGALSLDGALFGKGDSSSGAAGKGRGGRGGRVEAEDDDGFDDEDDEDGSD